MNNKYVFQLEINSIKIMGTVAAKCVEEAAAHINLTFYGAKYADNYTINQIMDYTMENGLLNFLGVLNNGVGQSAS